jgi:hypothetical protein
MSVELHLIADIPQKALIVRDGKLLIRFDQRWELPGGRLHIDEAPHDGLRRSDGGIGAEINVIGIHDTFTFFRGEMQHFVSSIVASSRRCPPSRVRMESS